MRLTQGMAAPAFSSTDVDGAPFSLGEYKGRKLYMILGRFASCPFCSLRLQDVAEHHRRYRDAGIEVVVVFPSKEKRVRRYQERYSPPFRVVADPEQEIFNAFGSETSWAGEIRSAANLPKVLRSLVRAKMNPLAIDDEVHRMPSEYLIGPDGRIGAVHYGAVLDDGFPPKEVLEWAQAS